MQGAESVADVFVVVLIRARRCSASCPGYHALTEVSMPWRDHRLTPGVLCIPRVGHRPDGGPSWFAVAAPSASRFRSAISVASSDMRFRPPCPFFSFALMPTTGGG